MLFYILQSGFGTCVENEEAVGSDFKVLLMSTFFGPLNVVCVVSRSLRCSWTSNFDTPFLQPVRGDSLWIFGRFHSAVSRRWYKYCGALRLAHD